MTPTLLLPTQVKDDKCTFFPEGDWFSCCAKHDMDYTYSSSKWKADRELRRCVIRSGNPVTAWIIWIGVSLFGWGWWFWAKYKNVSVPIRNKV